MEVKLVSYSERVIVNAPSEQDSKTPKYKFGDRKYIVANHGGVTDVILDIHLVEILLVKTIVICDGYFPYVHRYNVHGFSGKGNGFDKKVEDVPESCLFDSFDDAKTNLIHKVSEIEEYSIVDPK